MIDKNISYEDRLVIDGAKPIPGHRQYVITREGSVYRTWGRMRKPGQPLRHQLRKVTSLSGRVSYYMAVTLITKDHQMPDGEIVDLPHTRPQFVHRLVAFAWIGMPSKEKPWVNHKDGDKMNNNADNLEWSSISENIKHKWSIPGNEPVRGEKHHRFGKKLTQAVKNKMSLDKIGENHPKFKGWYQKDGVKYTSARSAIALTGDSRKTITASKNGWSFTHRGDDHIRPKDA